MPHVFAQRFMFKRLKNKVNAMQLLHSSIVNVSVVHLQHWSMLTLTNDNVAKERRDIIMAYYTDTHARGDLTERALATVAQFLENAATRHAQRRVYRETISELSALSGRDLADLGIHFGEIKRIAYEAAYKA